MNREDIIRMAREADLRVGPSRDGPDDVWGVGANLERFAALVAAAKDEEHKEAMRWDVHSCGPTCKRYACAAIREAVAAAKAEEREACAKVCESTPWTADIEWWKQSTKKEVGEKSAYECATAIRERSLNAGARAVGDRAYDRYEGETK